MQTIQLSIILDDAQANLYSVFGNAQSSMALPPAWQQATPFGVDIGGVNPAFYSALTPGSVAQAEFDSWITIGASDGSLGTAIASIGIDWPSWSVSSGLDEITDGAVFLMDPTIGPTGTVLVAQLTVPSGQGGSATMSAQGKVAGGDSDWQCPGATWTWDAASSSSGVNSNTGIHLTNDFVGEMGTSEAFADCYLTLDEIQNDEQAQLFMATFVAHMADELGVPPADIVINGISTDGDTVQGCDGTVTPPPPAPAPGTDTLTTHVTVMGTSVDDYTTIRLSATLPSTAANVYAMVGCSPSAAYSTCTAMSFPAAYQVAAPFGADTSGVNPAFFANMPNSEFDSWLTVGMTDGSSTTAIASTPDFPWDSWTESQALSVSEGGVFWMDPNDGPVQGEDVTFAQLTLSADAWNSGGTAQATLQGQSTVGCGGLAHRWCNLGLVRRRCSVPAAEPYQWNQPRYRYRSRPWLRSRARYCRRIFGLLPHP